MPLIRPAHSPDLDRILQIWLHASIQAHGFIPAHFWQAQLHNMRELYLPMANNYVIEQNAVVMGFISILSTEQCIAALFIAPEFQGQGFGSRLLGFAQQQSNRLNLQVYTKNEHAMQFYLHHGFRIVSQSMDEHTQQSQADLQWFAP